MKNKWSAVLWAILTILTVGCSDNEAGEAAQPPSPVETPPEPNPEAIPDDDPNCEVFKVGLPVLDTTWLTAQVAAGVCAATPPLVADVDGELANAVLYASCEEPGASPAECSLTSDMQLCKGGHWTKLCQANADCPAGTVCLWANGTGTVPAYYDPPFGTCEKTCAVAGNVECGRCDMECNTSMGVCAVKPDNTM